MEETLFSNRVKRPLADRLRPRKLEEVVGQEQVLGEDSPLGRMLFTGRISSFILWGPPGCGKTTIARLIAEHTNLYFEQISAVFSGKKRNLCIKLYARAAHHEKRKVCRV